jgi:prepilin-type N-terminal cleavage/methylation domain-containing protein
MINKIVRMLNQEQGFTLMELMIVVVIIGILAGVAVPVYNGVQDRAKYAVGEANATMLNRGLRQLKELGYYDHDRTEVIEIPDNEYDPDDHEGLLMTFLGFEEGDEIEYVEWNSSSETYDANIEEKITVSLEYDIPEETE